MKFSFEGSLLSEESLNQVAQRLKPEIEAMNRAALRGYEDDHASINLPLHENHEIEKLTLEKKRLNPEYVVVVGLGGSNLGTIAVQEAVLGKLYNQRQIGTKILYVDTVDSGLMRDIMEIINPVLKQGGNIIVNGVSKSGGTTESIANFELLIELLKKYKKTTKSS